MPKTIDNLLWSDPLDDGNQKRNPRGNGVRFGKSITERFLKSNDFQVLVRSHEWCEGGVRIQHDGLTLTVFSAPNYYGDTSDGAVLVLRAKSKEEVLPDCGLMDLIDFGDYDLFFRRYSLAPAPEEPNYFNTVKLLELLSAR
ncbi:hypothetical protein GEMRC1_013232 [Eukaryota sp. GEM-RC1]